MHYLADKRVRGRPKVRTHKENKIAQVEPVPIDSSTATRLADEYNVSRSTIKRDAQVATADEKRSKIREIINMFAKLYDSVKE